MVRTQIQLTEEQHRALKQWARRRRISLAEAVRRCVEERLAQDGTAVSPEGLLREAAAVFGKYADPEGASDIGRDHDRYLDRAYRA